MAVNAVISGDALARGLRNEFANTWQRRYDGLKDRLGSVMELGVPSDKFEELYGYYETAPYPRRRPWGEAVPSKPFRARNFAVENVAWSISVEWYKHQRLFDQLRDLERAARQAGENFATLGERILFQILTGGSDAALLGTIPTAPDGATLFSATDGSGSDRFGTTGGNVIATGSAAGVGTSEAVRSDFFDGLERMAQFQDPEGQPALDAGIIDQGVTIAFNVANLKVFREAFEQGYTLQKIAGTSTTDISTAAAVTNVIMDSGMAVTLVPTQRLTDDDWFMWLNAHDPKPVFEQVAQPLEEYYEDESNSDRARRLKLEGIYWEAIMGYGVNLPLGIMKVDVTA